MSYFSQTGNIVINTKHSPSTAPNTDKKIGVIYSRPKNVMFFDNSNHIKNLKKPKNEAQEELTREEEVKFYKKVFKTSLI